MIKTAILILILGGILLLFRTSKPATTTSSQAPTPTFIHVELVQVTPTPSAR